jgi:hypothetical protein
VDPQSVRRRVEETWQRVADPGHAFSLTVAPGDVVVELSLTQRAIQLGGARLGAALVAAVRAAGAAADAALTEAFPPGPGSDPDPVAVLRGRGPGLVVPDADAEPAVTEATDPSGRVRAGVGTAGGLRSLHISDSAMVLGPERLAERILTAVRFASHSAARATAERLAPTSKIDVRALVARYQPPGMPTEKDQGR